MNEMKKQIVTVGNSNVAVKEFKGQRVVTFKDIDTVHERPEGTAGRNFRENRDRFVEGEDYFYLEGEKLKVFKQTTNFVGSKARELVLMTEQGYLMLAKSLTDDLSWKVQRQLVSSYFKKEAAPQNEKKLDKPKKESRASVNMTAKIVESVFSKAGVSNLYIAAEVKRIYSEAGYDIKIPLITDKETMPKLYDCTEVAKVLGIYSTSDKPHNQAVSAIIKKLHISESEIVTTAFSRNGHADVTVQYKPSVVEAVKLWLEDNNYPMKIPCTDSKGNQKTCTVVYKEEA